MTLNRGYSYNARIGPAAAGRRVRDHLAAVYAHSDATAWNARLQAGEIELDGQLAHGDETVRTGQHLVWHRRPWHEPEVPLSFDVLYEDAAVLAVSKPSGLPTMPAGGFLEHTLLALVRARSGDAYPLHRLGRFTSGIVLFARTHDAAAALSRAWRAHEVTKDYRALAVGTPLWDTRTITTPIGPVPHPTLGTVHAACAGGRSAHSVVTVVERRVAHPPGEVRHTLCDVRIITGRPHQIRIHLAAAGHPLAGDPVYAPGGQPRPDEPGLPGDGGYLLHAHRLRVARPDGTGALAFEALPPAGLMTGGDRS